MDAMFMLLGIAALYAGFADLGVWSGITPGGGFMPALAGGFMLVFCLQKLFDKRKPRVHFTPAFKTMLPSVSILLTLGASYAIGMLPSIGLMVFFWLKWIEKYSFRQSIQVACIVVLLTYGIFKVWLKVFFPWGLLGEIF
jgi:hypothetical protein